MVGGQWQQPREITNLSEFIKIARGDVKGMPKVKSEWGLRARLLREEEQEDEGDQIQAQNQKTPGDSAGQRRGQGQHDQRFSQSHSEPEHPGPRREEMSALYK